MANKRKKESSDYRQLYKDYYGINFGSDMAIHHMDFNRENNSPDNLIMLPRGLHAKYHFHVSTLGGTGTGEIKINARIDCADYDVAMLRGLADALEEASKWVRLKKSMDMDKFSREMLSED